MLQYAGGIRFGTVGLRLTCYNFMQFSNFNYIFCVTTTNEGRRFSRHTFCKTVVSIKSTDPEYLSCRALGGGGSGTGCLRGSAAARSVGS